jgi:hypothetical protein
MVAKTFVPNDANENIVDLQTVFSLQQAREELEQGRNSN